MDRKCSVQFQDAVKAKVCIINLYKETGKWMFIISDVKNVTKPHELSMMQIAE